MNKYEKALEHMETCKYENRCKDCKLKLDCTFEEDHKLLQELVDKTIPMKTDVRKEFLEYVNRSYFIHKCVNCGNDVYKFGDYCSKCGQKIDWSEEE